MNKTMTMFKIQTILLLVVLLIGVILCFKIGSTASASTEQYEELEDYGSMTFDIILFAMCKNGQQNMIPVAGVQMLFAIDYIPSTDPNYDYYVARLDIKVVPESKFTLKRFTMTPARWYDNGCEIMQIRYNEGYDVIAEDIYYKTGITARDGANFYNSDVNILISQQDKEVLYEYKTKLYDESEYSKRFSPGIEITKSEDTSRLTHYAGKPMIIRRYNRSNSTSSSDLKNDKGKIVSVLYYSTYRVKKNISYRSFGFVFDQLEIWGQAGEPSYQLSNDDNLKITASWENGFKNKSIFATKSDVTGSQYLVTALANSSLSQVVERSETIYSYRE